MKTDRYKARGASTGKEDVHAAVDRLDKGLFPGAFCKVIPDLLGKDPLMCNVIHSDGCGTKAVLAYLHYRETGDASVFRGIAQDSIVMNIDDLICVGVTGGIVISNTINRNSRSCPAEVVANLIEGSEEFLELLRKNGVDVHGGGGETADVGDLTGTVVVDTCAVARLRRDAVLPGRIGPGLSIVGLSSAGRAVYEKEDNSGIGSNGLTSARHDILNKYYGKKYPETFDSGTDPAVVYCGQYRMADALPGSTMTVGKALLSPTRTYAPVVLRMMRECRSQIKAIVHCSGGGQTKCLRFGDSAHFIKDALMPLPPLFAEIKKCSQTSWEEMFRVFNMGHRLEIYCEPGVEAELIAVAESFGVAAKVIGRTEASVRKDKGSHLSISSGGETIRYG